MISIIKYNERSFVVFGEETKKHKDFLMENGGGYNRYLKPTSGEGRYSGWIFPMTRKKQLFENMTIEGIQFEEADEVVIE